jgi:hypothetical protein
MIFNIKFPVWHSYADARSAMQCATQINCIKKQTRNNEYVLDHSVWRGTWWDNTTYNLIHRSDNLIKGNLMQFFRDSWKDFILLKESFAF